MAKNQAAAQSETSSNPQAKKLETRAGLKKFTGDVLGFKDPEKQGALYGIPRGAKHSDSKIDSKKPSTFVIFELLEDTLITEGSAEDAAEIMAKKGDMVGLWTKGGMRPLRKLCGVAVLVQHTGEKVLKGRPKGQDPMKTYQFDVGEGVGTLIPVIEDSRRESRNEPTFLDPKKKDQADREPGADEGDEYSFPS